MNDFKPTGGRRPRERVGVSGPTSSPWLRILGYCSASAGIVVLILCAVAALVVGGAAALSAAFGAVVVVLFFALSLLVGHYVGRKNPSGAIGVFLVTYLVKVVGFAVVLYFIGTPSWLDGTWFFITAVATVLVWQATEVFAFARLRFQLFNDPAPKDGSGHA
jgi:ATP synthase protein I